MQAQVEIENLIKRGNEPDIFGNIVYSLMTNLNQPYSEIMKMPLPLVFELLRITDKQNKEMEKQMKKRGRR